MKWAGPGIFELATVFAIVIYAYALLLMSRESSFADGLESGCTKSELNSLTHGISQRAAGLLSFNSMNSALSPD
jgi:hypothetical protein